MAKPPKPVFYMLFFTGIILLLILLLQPLQLWFFGKDIAVLFPKGWVAFEQRNLLLIIQGMMLLVIIPVYILTFIFSWRYRADNKNATYDPDLVDHKIAEIIWWGVPFVMVAIISVLTWVKTHELDPFKPITSDKKPVKIEAIALQWKWLFLYPEENIATVNYLQIPEKTPIAFDITADAPMNSLWIPDLGGQIYAMPAMKTQLNLIANETGEFRGSSANISGEGFAGMHFMTKSVSDQDYEAWVKTVKESGKPLDFKSYEELAAPSKNEPVGLYQLKDTQLFNKIMMKYMEPAKHR
jgi:cytochrome o ubiquinol oxidase subunit 2